MAFCGKCGEKVSDGVKFCPSCGASMTGKPAKAAAQAGEIQADPTDAEQNKGMAVIAYILFFVPLLTGDHKKSPFVMFHTNQATVLFIFSAIGMTASSMLVIILIGLVLMPIFGIFVLVLVIMGILNAVNGRMKPLPLIGKFTIIK